MSIDLPQNALNAKTAGNENTGVIKLIAIFFMLIDHVAAALLTTRGLWPMPGIYNEMRLLGRIAMPLFCWGIVVGAEYTRNIWKYFLRIMIVAVIAQPCFMLALNHQWNQLNVFPTLGLGVLAIAGIKWKKGGSQIWLPALALLISLFVEMDYGWRGVALILILYGCRKSKGALAAGFVAYCLYLGLVYGSYQRVFGLQFSDLRIPLARFGSSEYVFNDLARMFFQVEFWAIFALPFILIPMKKRLRVPKWIGYGVYPFHLLVIGVIRHWGEIEQAVSAWLQTFPPA